MTENIQQGLIASGIVIAIGCVSVFFSTRRKAFIRTFSRPGELRAVVRAIPRDSKYKTGMRFIGFAQIGLGIVIGFVSLSFWLWRASSG
jgi:hypothetical protein